MIKPHLLFISSPDKVRLLELSVSSFKKHSCTDFFGTLIVNTLENGKFSSDYLNDNMEVINKDTHFKDHPTDRWELDPKSDVCLFIDYDIITMSDVRPLIKMCHDKNSICGVLAYYCLIDKANLKKSFEMCGVNYIESRTTWIDEEKIPRYYNYGVLAVPSNIMKKMRIPLAINVDIINKLSKETGDDNLARHGGQIALAITIEKLKISTVDLDIKYNFPNAFPEFQAHKPNDVVFEHLLDKSDEIVEEMENRLSQPKFI